MNYSVFTVQNKGGKPGIFWEKDGRKKNYLKTFPKQDKKFGYKKKEQRFPIRRHPSDTHEVDRGLGTLTPDDAPPPPKPPAKNFIKKNRELLAAQKKKKDQNSTVTLTQEQLNAILKSVGKIAGGKENALKISIDNTNNRHEISIESPRRKDDDDSEEEREKRRPKKKPTKRRDDNEDEEPASIYALLGKKDQPKSKSQDWSDSEKSEVEEKYDKPRRKTRRESKSKRRDEDESDDRRKKDRHRSKQRYDDENENDNDRDNRRRQNRSKYNDDDYDSDREYETRKNRTKHRDESYDDDDELDNRHRKAKPKYHDYSDNDSDDGREKHRGRGQKGRTRNSEKNEKLRNTEKRRDRNDSKDRDFKTLDADDKNLSGDKLDPIEVSPRDKVGLPSDLSWRHMTKAERLRLTVARNKFMEEEERREEDRIKNLMAKYGGVEPSPQMKPAPEKKHSKKSDRDRPPRRINTEESNYSDYRRGQRSPSEPRSRTPDRSRTPERARTRSRTPELHHSHSSPYSSPKADKPPGIPRQHMTLAEKKRIEWERDRVESVQIQRHGGEFDPWGRPGAGAPLRTKSGHVVADYKNRQEHLLTEEPIPEETAVVVSREDRSRAPERRRPEREPQPPPLPAGQEAVPHAMRSSFVFGGTTEVDKYADVKEQERKQWLAELEKQIEEKRMKDAKNTEVKEEETWADKFGQSHRKLPFPEQPKETVASLRDSYGHAGQEVPGLETNRAQSAPEVDPDNSTFIRGQNVPIDPVTRKEMEEKRRRYLEHQAAVRAQVEEKERLKRAEREKKLQEDLEEERKLQAERDMLQKQFEMEQQKLRQKEQQRQAQVNMLKAAMDEAQAKAMQDKYQRKMQHLEKGGHDTTKLRENLEGQITSRIEQLHTRRERDILRAQKLQQLSNFSQGQNFGPNQDHDIEKDVQSNEKAAKVTPRSDYQSELPGGVILHEPQFVPGLDLSTVRTTNYQQAPAESRRIPVNEPYTEDRVLTPSRFRRPSKPFSDLGSPRREFGTQTIEDTDAATLLNSSFNRELSDVEIEYKIDKGKKVRVISAPKEKPLRKAKETKENEPPTSRRDMSPHMHHHEHIDQKQKELERKKKKLEDQRRKGPVKPGSRPKWNYKNPDSKKAAKQSEKDPFYVQKKRESDYRRLKREQKLLAMVEANKAVIPDYYAPSQRSMSPHSDFGAETPREIRLGRRSKSHSPKRPKLDNESDYLPVHADDVYTAYERTKVKSPIQEKSESQTQRFVDNRQSRSRNRSPPIPAIKHRYEAQTDGTNLPIDRHRKGVSSYSDIDPLEAPVQNGDFVPFMRTIDVLDPAKAVEPLPLSREATRILNARKVYHGGLQPDKYGNKQNNFQDKQRLKHSTVDSKDPIMNPGLVTDHPTARQDQILMQLSTLKQSLMQRQRELETFSPTDLEQQNTFVT